MSAKSADTTISLKQLLTKAENTILMKNDDIYRTWWDERERNKNKMSEEATKMSLNRQETCTPLEPHMSEGLVLRDT